MSASDEIDEMHLTPNGWVQGSEKVDFQGWTRREPPIDRLLTARFREYISSGFSPMERTADITKYSSDTDILAALEKHGVEPQIDADRYYGWQEFLSKIGFKK